jgi:hypothetical protein
MKVETSAKQGMILKFSAAFTAVNRPLAKIIILDWEPQINTDEHR